MTEQVAAKLHWKRDPKPKFWRPQPLPFALKSAVKAELDRLLSLGIIEPVNYCEWATPIITVLKRDGKLCQCGNYKVTINPALNGDQYPLP